MGSLNSSILNIETDDTSKNIEYSDNFNSFEKYNIKENSIYNNYSNISKKDYIDYNII